MPPESVIQFQETVWGHYRDYGRHDLPWRLPDKSGAFDPYGIIVSEIMLQQTQVSRVIPKFTEFIEIFPSFEQLARAPLANVIRLWNGLGYNRRARYLWQTAGTIENEFHGQVPRTPEKLAELPGIGLQTAGAIIAYTFNQPVIFIETNIRTVMLHHFFAGQERISDRQIVEFVRQTLPEEALTKEWYWALMDYGSHIKQHVGNVSRAAAGYTKQSRFEGSNRQIRGLVLRLLSTGPKLSRDLQAEIGDDRLSRVLSQLVNEQLIHERGGYFVLGN